MERVRAVEEAGQAARSPGRTRPRVALGLEEIDAVLGGGLARGAVHEWVGIGGHKGPRDQGTKGSSGEGSSGRGSSGGGGGGGGSGEWLAPVCLVTHVARRALASMPWRWVVWVYGKEATKGGAGGSGGLPGYGRTLVGPGGDDALLRRSIFVEAPDRASRLWAIDLALRCEGVACVVGDGRGFDVAATRRLQLAARAGGTLGVLARPPTEAHGASVASSRWLVARAAPGTSMNADASEDAGGVRWIVELMRCKGVRPSTEAPRRWALEWSFETGNVSVAADMVGGSGRAQSLAEPRRSRGLQRA